MATAHMFVDYQNLHLTAWECFSRYGTPVHESLIHPAKFADRVAASWAAVNGAALDIQHIGIYRGLPDSRKESRQNSRVNKQHANWKRDTRVQVKARPLRYPRDWPDEKAQEKGVDVMLALDVVRCSLANSCDYIIVVTRDTDILPAIEMAEVEKPGAIIIATWDGSSSILRANPPVPTLRLGIQDYNRSRDTTHYS
jgi:uncharacterized LabA/DUF88 family protein